EDYSREDAAGDAATLVVFGFAPPDIDLHAVYMDVFVEQIGGFYDPEEGRLFLVTRPGGDAAAEHQVVEHELVHALQDQSFDLSVLGDPPFEDSDVETALHALVEGDASFFSLLTMAGDFMGDITLLSLGNGGALVATST